MLLLIGASVGAGIYWQSWIVGGIAFVGLLASGYGLKLFFQSAIGKKVLKMLAILRATTVVAFAVYLVYMIWGAAGLAWLALISASVAAIIGLARLLQWFFQTQLGRFLIRATRFAFMSALVIGFLVLAAYLAGFLLA